MISINTNAMYSIDADGKHSLEVSYSDSDGVNVGAYSEGDNFVDVISDAVDQLDEAVAEYGDDQADIEESSALQNQITELQAQIDDLQAQLAESKARSEELEQRHAKKLDRTKYKKYINDFLDNSDIVKIKEKTIDSDLQKILDNLRKGSNDPIAGKNKISDFPFGPKWWA